MKALNYTLTNELIEYDHISNSKHEPSRTVLSRLRTRVEPHYQDYLKRFSSIQKLPNNPFIATHSTHLKNCYYKPTAALDNLKARLVNAQSNTYKLLCPYCLISNHSTFDHYIPIEQHPVFGVLAKNLVPCCDVCNKRKLEYWAESNQRAIIHFYNDSIPNVQFLYCDLVFNGNVPVLSFRLDFTSVNRNASLRLKRHFTRLDLLNRYDEAVPGLLSDIDVDIKAIGALKPSRPGISRFLRAKSHGLSLACGDNYWRAQAYNVLGRSQQYIRTL